MWTPSDLAYRASGRSSSEDDPGAVERRDRGAARTFGRRVPRLPRAVDRHEGARVGQCGLHDVDEVAQVRSGGVLEVVQRLPDDVESPPRIDETGVPVVVYGTG